jgi:hypothetical protein
VKTAVRIKPQASTPLLPESNFDKDRSLDELRHQLDVLIASKQSNNDFDRPCFDSRRHCTTSGFKAGFFSLSLIVNRIIASIAVCTFCVVFSRLREVLSAQYLQNMKLVDLSNDDNIDGFYKDVIFLGVDVSSDAQIALSLAIPSLSILVALLVHGIAIGTTKHRLISFFSDKMKNKNNAALSVVIEQINIITSMCCFLLSGLSLVHLSSSVSGVCSDYPKICPDLFDYYNVTFYGSYYEGSGVLLEDKAEHMVNQLADAVAESYLPLLCVSGFLAMVNFVVAYLELILMNDLCYRSKSKVFCNDKITYRSEWVAKEKLEKTSPSSRCRLYDALGETDEYSDEELNYSNSMLLQFNSIGIALLKKIGCCIA